MKNIIKNIDFKDKKIINVIIVILLGIILLIAMSSFGGDGIDAGVAEQTARKDSDYAQQFEEQLVDILSKVEGAGRVDCLVTLQNYGERVAARDVNVTEDREDGGRNSVKRDESVVFGNRGAEQPFIMKETTPKILGVLVIAEGAHDDKVRLRLYEAVRAVSGAPRHRITIAERKNN